MANKIDIENNDLDIEIRDGEVSFRRYRDKNKNDMLLEMLKELFSEEDYNSIEGWVRAGEDMLSPFGTVDDIIYCG